MLFEVKVLVKPYVQQYFLSRYGNGMPFIQLSVHRRLYKEVKRALTSQFSERTQHTDLQRVPLRLALPRELSQCFIARNKSNEVTNDIEDLFWDEAEAFIRDFLRVKNSIVKAIDAFYTLYGIDDETYSRDHFKRQIVRAGIRVTKTSFTTQRQAFRLVSNETADLIKRNYRTGLFSQAELARKFDVDQKTISNIVRTNEILSQVR